MKIRSPIALATAIAVASSFAAYAQNKATYDVNVDTGSHTCTAQGQDWRVYKEIYAGDGRYFTDVNLSTVSQFGAGNCVWSPDGGANPVYGRFKFTDADGEIEVMEKPVRYVVRAYADCTNDLGRFGSRVGTECKFTAKSKKGAAAP